MKKKTDQSGIELVICFTVFAVIMLAALSLDLSMIIPLLIGFALFFAAAMRRGFHPGEILSYAIESVRDSFLVVGILLLIGCLTGMWRQNGTVAYFISLGISRIPARLFLLASFFLTSLMSYALGTSFGVTATAGVILISIARAGGVNPTLAAGAILSGVYVGDRGSPASSSGNLVSVMTHTDMRKNVRMMLKDSILPFAACLILYGILSLFWPMQEVDHQVFDLLRQEYTLNPICLLPAICMIILPFLGVAIRSSMGICLLISVLTSVLVQKASLLSVLHTLLFGYIPLEESLQGMLSGGGILSMAEVSMILLISGTYGGIFRKTGLLIPLTEKLKQLQAKIGRYPTMLGLSALLAALFCNQTIGIMMESQLTDEFYGENEEERYRKMLDIENSVVLVAGLIPWCIACSVPLAMLDVGRGAILFGFYLWLVPLFYLMRK